MIQFISRDDTSWMKYIEAFWFFVYIFSYSKYIKDLCVYWAR